jgi:hypothetical protein
MLTQPAVAGMEKGKPIQKRGSETLTRTVTGVKKAKPTPNQRLDDALDRCQQDEKAGEDVRN